MNNPITVAIAPYRVQPHDANTVIIVPAAFGPPPSFQVSIGYTAADGSYEAHSGQTVQISTQQWNDWPAGTNDAAYIRSCILANLGLTAAT